MALLPDPTTAASERSSVKKRLTEDAGQALSVLKDVHNMRALIRRRSGINKGTDPEQSAKRV